MTKIAKVNVIIKHLTEKLIIVPEKEGHLSVERMTDGGF